MTKDLFHMPVTLVSNIFSILKDKGGKVSCPATHHEGILGREEV
jgi:hypothetical protein